MCKHNIFEIRRKRIRKIKGYDDKVSSYVAAENSYLIVMSKR